MCSSEPLVVSVSNQHIPYILYRTMSRHARQKNVKWSRGLSESYIKCWFGSLAYLISSLRTAIFLHASLDTETKQNRRSPRSCGMKTRNSKCAFFPRGSWANHYSRVLSNTWEKLIKFTHNRAARHTELNWKSNPNSRTHSHNPTCFKRKQFTSLKPQRRESRESNEESVYASVHRTNSTAVGSRDLRVS